MRGLRIRVAGSDQPRPVEICWPDGTGMHGGGTDVAPDCRLQCEVLRLRLGGLRARVELELEQPELIFLLRLFTVANGSNSHNWRGKSAPPARAFDTAPPTVGGAAAGALQRARNMGLLYSEYDARNFGAVHWMQLS